MKQGQNMCAFQASESSTPFRGRATLRNYAIFLGVFQPLGRAAWAECTCAEAQGVVLFSELVFFKKDLILSSTRRVSTAQPPLGLVPFRNTIVRI